MKTKYWIIGTAILFLFIGMGIQTAMAANKAKKLKNGTGTKSST